MVEEVAAEHGLYRIKNYRTLRAFSGSSFGQETYTVRCTWDQEYLKDAPGSTFNPGPKKGDIVHTPDGNLVFMKTDAGWLGPDGKTY